MQPLRRRTGGNIGWVGSLSIGGLAALIVSVLVETPVDPPPESLAHPEAEKVYQR